MISIELIIFILINALFFFVIWFKTLFRDVVKKYETIEKADMAILGIAFTQYAITFVIENSNVLEKDSIDFAQNLRYVDWLITTPLLLFTYWKLANLEGWTGDFVWLFFADMLMMICGIFAEFFAPNKKISMLLYSIGCLGYVYIFIEIIRIMNFFNDKQQENKANIGYFFLIGWLIYPIGFFLPFESKFILYSIGDFSNKGLYSIALQNVMH